MTRISSLHPCSFENTDCFKHQAEQELCNIGSFITRGMNKDVLTKVRTLNIKKLLDSNPQELGERNLSRYRRLELSSSCFPGRVMDTHNHLSFQRLKTQQRAHVLKWH